MLNFVSGYGEVTRRLVFGDRSNNNLKGWLGIRHKFILQFEDEPAYVHGKNSTDIGLVIEALKLYYEDKIRNFCIVSSDSDFTRLAARIRESGLVVYGFGEQKTPKPFVSACDKFIYFENILYDVVPRASASVAAPLDKRVPSTTARSDTDLERQLRMAIEAIGWLSGEKRVIDGSLTSSRNFGVTCATFSRTSCTAATGWNWRSAPRSR